MILAEAGVKAGDVFIDLACGFGFFAIPAAKIVGPGGVICGVDVDKEALEELSEKVSGANGIPGDQVILNAALASRAENNDTIDLAVLGGLKDKDALKGFEVTHFQPFDAVHKRTEATVKGSDGKEFKATKGAPQVILALSANAAQVKAAVEKAVNEFAARGFRSLGVARAEGNGQWQFLGVLPLFDPPREDAKATIETARNMGVKVKMPAMRERADTTRQRLARRHMPMAPP